MKKVISLLVSGIVFLQVYAQDIPESHAVLMDKFINNIIHLEKTSLVSAAIPKVFKGQFYRILPTYVESDGTSSSCNDYIVVINGNVLAQPEKTGSDIGMDVLFSLLKDDFFIPDEGDAAIFEDALDAIYPMSWSDDEKDKKHFYRDGKWYFIRGYFFDDMKGFILEVDGNGKINGIQYSLRIPVE